MSLTIGFLIYDSHELDELEYDREGPLLCFYDNQLDDELLEKDEIILEEAEEVIEIFKEVLNLAHSDVPEFEDALEDLNCDRPEFGFRVTKEDFSTMLFKVREKLGDVHGEDVMYDIGRIRDDMERLMIQTDWEQSTVYLFQVIR
jgi:hypothetical protein